MPTTIAVNDPLPPPLSGQAEDEIVRQIIKIGQFSKLHDNWDSYGGKAVSLELCEKAARYLYIAFKELLTESQPMMMPFIAPANDGSLVFEWKSDGAELIVVFRSNAQSDVEYLTVAKSNDKEFEKEGVFNSPAAFVQAVRWFSMTET